MGFKIFIFALGYIMLERRQNTSAARKSKRTLEDEKESPEAIANTLNTRLGEDRKLQP